MSGPPTQLSVVAPCFNDAVLARQFAEHICAQLEGKLEFELVLVDDGSRDNTPDAILEMASATSRIRALCLARNYGQQIAVTAGVEAARGEFVLVMDSDMQNPPEEVLHLYAKIQEGYDIVYTVDGTRNNAVDEWTSNFFWFCMRSLVGTDIVSKQLMMRIMSRTFVDHFKRYPERGRSIFGITNDIGMRRGVLPIRNRRRERGRSGYSFLKRLGLFLDILLGATTAPLDATILVGSITSAAALAFGLYHFINYWRGGVTEGFTTVVILITLLGGIQISLLGMIGKYLSYIYRESRMRPLYLVARRSEPA